MLVVDWRAWIRVLDRHAWIGVLLTMLGSKFQISPVLGLEFQMEILDRHLDGNFRSAFEFQMKISAWIRVSDRCRAPYLDRNFREEFGIERSFREE